ncbi:hypothetical protein INR49_014458 [Caranx melampygus]|nr:hypothetical protein INR49_014458 [Caranx melampygus]
MRPGDFWETESFIDDVTELPTRLGLQLPAPFVAVLCVYNQLTSGVFPSISHRYPKPAISVYTRYFPYE